MSTVSNDSKSILLQPCKHSWFSDFKHASKLTVLVLVKVWNVNATPNGNFNHWYQRTVVTRKTIKLFTNMPDKMSAHTVWRNPWYFESFYQRFRVKNW